MSNFVPPDPNYTVLQVKLNLYLSSDHCAHLLYSSSEQFVHHILWILHPKSLEHPLRQEHVRFMLWQSVMSNMCTNCVNILLCTVRFVDVINLYSLYRVPTVPPPKDSTCLLPMDLYASLFCHPKIHRIMMNTCSLNKLTYLAGEKMYAMHNNMGTEGYVHDFDYLCDIFTVELRIHSTDINSSLSQQLVFMRTLYLSMKHWNKYHLLFFSKHYLMDLKQASQGIANLPTHNQLDTVGRRVFSKLMYMIGYIEGYVDGCCEAKRVLKQLKQGNNTALMRTRIRKVMKQRKDIKQSNETRKCIKEEVLTITCCGWHRCSKRQKEINGALKLCKQCRMTYFCSRRCQKKAWKHDHRNICLKLKEYYGMS
eukprot:44816_1